jgi:peroxiredoxin
MMEKKVLLMIVAAALLPLASCAKTDSASSTASTPTSTEGQENRATESPSATVDSEVVQTAATIEESARPTNASGEIGATAPEWKNLPGTDDKQHSLADLGDAKAVVAVFTCNSCPVAIAYEDRLIALANEYKDKDVEFVAINVNNDESNALAAMKERAEEKGFPFAYLYDSSQQIARDYGATVTPHTFVLNEQRKVVYAGAIDDNQGDPSAVKEQYLRAAIDATLAGQEPTVATMKPVGCGIKYE